MPAFLTPRPLTEEVLDWNGRGDKTSCGHPNPCWSADSQLWNEVMNGGDRDLEASGILCPSCFADRAHAYFEGSRWRILHWRLIPDWGRPRVDDLLADDYRTRLQAIVDEQAGDEGVWFEAATAPEAYLQQELRRLHAAIETETK